MTIKALHGGKLLCLMAAVAGITTLGSCKDDDDDPAPVNPVDTTPQKVVIPDEFYFSLNDSTPDTLNAGDTIKANTLLANGTNSDSISIKVVLRNNTMVDSASVSLSVSNQYLGDAIMQDSASIADSVFSVTFPAIEGKYSLSINGKSRNFVVAGDKSNSAARNLSNKYVGKLNTTDNAICGFEFVPKEEITVAHLKGEGKFVILSDEEYNEYLNSKLALVKAFIEDIPAENKKNLLPLKDLKHFAYVVEEENVFVVNVVSGNTDDATEIIVEIAY